MIQGKILQQYRFGYMFSGLWILGAQCVASVTAEEGVQFSSSLAHGLLLLDCIWHGLCLYWKAL